MRLLRSTACMLIIILLFSFLQFYISQGYQLLDYPTDRIVKDGTIFNLECTFSYQPILISWLFNDVEAVQLSNNSTIVITASTETAGYYQCIGYFELGTVVSKPALIQIGYIRTTVDFPVDVVGSVGSWLLLSCEHILSLPSADILWLEEDLFEGPVTLTDSMEYLHNGSLLFSNLSLTDAGVYICLASNSYIQEFRRVIYNLTVSAGLFGISGISPQLLFVIPEINIVSSGEDAIFQCLVDSSYLSALSWYYKGSPISSSTSYLIRDDGVTLVVISPSTEASGEYMCVVDGLGSVSANLSVLDPPMVSISGSTAIETDLESSFSLTCVLEQGFTNVKWSWIKNGDPVNTTIFVEGELIVNYAQETDEGLYQCVASNNVGRDMKTFRVRVISYSPRFRSSEHLPSVILFTSSPISLNCSADSVPAPQYSWSRDSIPLNEAITQGFFSTPAPGILVKNSLSKEDSGNYTCIVSNSVGVIQRSTYITVLDGTKFIHEPSPGSFALAQDNYLVCEASVDEELSLLFNWLVDGIFLQTTNRVSYLSPQQGTLLFRDTQQSDTGEYQCIVEAIYDNSDVIPESYLYSRLVSIQVLNVSAAPTNLTVTDVNTNSFTLSWIPASTQPSSLFHIFLSIQFMNGTVQTASSYQVEESPARLTDLLPYTLYFIQVSGGSQSVIGPKSQPPLLIRTQQAVPTSSPVGLYSFLIEEDSLMLGWDHPSERLPDGSGRNGEIVSYEISLSSQLITTRTFFNSSNYTSYQLTGLSPYTLYSVIVIAVGTEGRSPPSSSHLVKTLAAEPSKGPKEISCKAGSDTSIACRVELPYLTSRNGYIDGYEVSYREVDTEEWNSIYVGNNAILSYMGDIRELLISELLPNTRYYLNVSLYNNVSNSIRVGPFLSVGPVATRNPVPGAPTKLILSTINSNSITASWSLPSRLDSEVTSYRLVLSQLSSPTHKLQLLMLDLNSSVSSYTFSGLDADTSYSVYVAAGNSNGLGFEMENRTTLNPGPPSPPNFRIFISGSTVFLYFSPGATGGSPILSYRLEYSWDGENWLEINTFNSSAREYRTRSLPSGTFLVRAVVETLLGEAGSEELIITIPDRSLLNELSVQIVIGVAVLLLILLVIAVAGCICILYIRRKSRINYKFSRTNVMPNRSTQNYSFDSNQDSWDDTGHEQVKTRYLTEEQIVIGTPPDYGNFEIGSTVQSIEGRFTPVYPTTSHLLHLSPSISSLQKPSKNDCSLYPVWSKPPLFESPAHEPVPTTESRGYVDMKALQLEEERESTHIESSTSSDGDQQTVSEVPEEQYSPPKIFQNHYQMSLTPITPGTLLDSPYQEEHRLAYDPMFVNTSEWSISTAETDPRCQTFV